ncbi:MAG: PEP-CTERM sorting domain-containing protein [Pirellulales bacterium]
MKNVKFVIAAIALAMASSASVAQAGLVYSVEFSSTSLSGNTGTPWSVDVLLRETFQANDTPILATGGVGLLTGGFDVTLSDPGSVGTIITGASANVAFDNPTVINQTNTVASVTVAQNLGSNGITGQADGPSAYTLKIGSISGTFGNAGVPASVSFDNPQLNLFLDGNVNLLTPNLGANLQLLVITAVPEPSAALLTILGIGLAGFYRPSRSKN